MAKDRTKAIVKLTQRDLEIFEALKSAGWLTTTQIQRSFFSGRTTNAVSKRLRKLSEGRYIAMSRTSSTETGVYRLAGQGKLALIQHSGVSEEDVTIPTQIPRKLGHFAAINDLRFYFEQISLDDKAPLLFFFSERELATQFPRAAANPNDLLFCLSRYGILPDALAKFA
jgi:hypothetical protein